jgi:hypothetical protein
MPDRRSRLVVAALVLTAGIAAAAQDGPPAGLRFEAASIRPSSPGGPPISGTIIQGNRLRATRTSLLGLIRSVHYGDGLTSERQFVGGPDWIRTERWDINAVASSAPTRAQFNDLLRDLLADRFKVRARRELMALDPQVGVEFAVFDSIVSTSIARERLGMALLVTFGMTALLLAAVGVYGLMSYSVSQRTGEMAVRSALEASGRQVMGLVMGRGMRLALAGVVIGVVGAVVLRRARSLGAADGGGEEADRRGAHRGRRTVRAVFSRRSLGRLSIERERAGRNLRPTLSRTRRQDADLDQRRHVSEVAQ